MDLLVNVFFTIGPQNRDLGAILPGNRSELGPASFWFYSKSIKISVFLKKKPPEAAPRPRTLLLRKIHKHIDFSKILGMASPGVENVPTPRESIFKLSPPSQRPSGAKNPKILFVINFILISPIFL